MFRQNKDESSADSNNSERLEDRINNIWEIVTTISDDIFEIKKKLGLESELCQGKRSERGLRNLLKIAVKQYPILHPSSIFDEISYHLAFSEGIDTRIHVSYKLPDGGDDVFEDETKKKIFDDWVKDNKDYWVRKIKITMGEVCGWGFFDALKESSVKILENEDSRTPSIYNLMEISLEFMKFKYQINTREISYFGKMNLEEKERCLKACIREIDKKCVEALYRKSQMAEDKY